MTREQRRFIWVMAIIIALILAVALYGFVSGGWEQTPA
jgi:uncharacterized membrane protein